MSVGGAQLPPGQGVSPLNFIYSCAVCCDTFADIYHSHDETVQGLSDGINPKHRLVTKLFLASCCHIFCSKHLSGGAPSFHPAGTRPQAPCPVCVKEKDDSQLRDLYSVRGFGKDEYDPQIPAEWFTAPPMRSQGGKEDAEALRFQYIALMRYCQNTYAGRKPLQEELANTKKQLETAQDLSSAEHAKAISLQKENQRLRDNASQIETLSAEVERLCNIEQEVEKYRSLNVNPHDLETFVTNKAAIRHYLKMVPTLIEQNERMQRRLASLGFAMAVEPLPRLQGVDPRTFDSDDIFSDEATHHPETAMRPATSSRTTGRLVHTPGKIALSPFVQRPMKRQRLDFATNNTGSEPLTSRDAMPPPPRPMSRLRSMHKVFPAIRKKFSHGHSRPSAADTTGRDSNNDMDIDNVNQNHAGERGASPVELRSPGPYMSGALPMGHLSQPASQADSRLLSSVGVGNEGSDFTFRASSPMKMNRTVSLAIPTEPSYIRLMDGLTREASGFELGLQDPRSKNTQNGCFEQSNRQVSILSEQRRHLRDSHLQQRSSFGPPYLHQSPCASSATVNDGLALLDNRTTNYSTRRTLTGTRHPVTPATNRQRQPDYPAENVVSPFFDSNRLTSPIYSPITFAEPQDSFNRSGAYQSRSRTMERISKTWDERRSLNGLSFFETPMRSEDHASNTSNRFSGASRISISSRPSEIRNISSQGYITRPKIGELPLADGIVHRNRTMNERQPFQPSRSNVHYRPKLDPIHGRRAHLPSTMSSIVSTQASRSYPQSRWESLQRAGVRSSRQVYSNTGRRSVRR